MNINISAKRLSIILHLHCLYFILTGIWPLLSISTFMMVTGPKTDIWLVKLVGLLAVAIGLSLYKAHKENGLSRSTLLLALVNAMAFGSIDYYYVAKDVIPFV